MQDTLGAYNDVAQTRDLIRASGNEIAAVLVEPMMGSAGCIPATREFLTMIREETAKAGIILIFDEVMTSRFSGGGAQGLDKITPDITTLGKYIGGGMSFGAFGGRKDIMAIFDPTAAGSMPHAGTFNNNVLSMAAGIAGMSKVFTPEVATGLNNRGEATRARINELFAREGVGLQASGRSSLMNIHPLVGPISKPDDLAKADDRVRELLFLDLLEQGFYMARRGFIALSLAIGDAEIDGFVKALAAIIDKRREVLPKQA